MANKIDVIACFAVLGLLVDGGDLRRPDLLTNGFLRSGRKLSQGRRFDRLGRTKQRGEGNAQQQISQPMSHRSHSARILIEDRKARKLNRSWNSTCWHCGMRASFGRNRTELRVLDLCG